MDALSILITRAVYMVGAMLAGNALMLAVVLVGPHEAKAAAIIALALGYLANYVSVQSRMKLARWVAFVCMAVGAYAVGFTLLD